MYGTGEKRSFLGIVASDEFTQLSKDEVCHLMGNRSLVVRGEADVFMAGLRWLMHDWARRRDHLEEVMSYVRFGFMSPWQLVNLQHNVQHLEEALVTMHPEVRQMIDRGMEYAIIRCHFGHIPHEFRNWVERLHIQDNEQREYSGERDAFTCYREFLEELETIRNQQPDRAGDMTMFHQKPHPRNMHTMPTNPDSA